MLRRLLDLEREQARAERGGVVPCTVPELLHAPLIYRIRISYPCPSHPGQIIHTESGLTQFGWLRIAVVFVTRVPFAMFGNCPILRHQLWFRRMFKG